MHLIGKFPVVGDNLYCGGANVVSRGLPKETQAISRVSRQGEKRRVPCFAPPCRAPRVGLSLLYAFWLRIARSLAAVDDYWSSSGGNYLGPGTILACGD